MKINRFLLVVAGATFLTACGGGGGGFDPVIPVVQPAGTAPPPPPVMQTYEVSISNLTSAQPFSPAAVIVHQDIWSVFDIGTAASNGLEVLAEGGDNSSLIGEADDNDGVFSTASGAGIIGPGGAETVSISILEDDAPAGFLSVVTMLVNTNDAITAARGVALSSLAVGESTTLETITYDAGTELNSELIGTIPGPADGGEGFNSARDDRADEVRGHTGVVTQDDGLSDSVLTQAHRWDNPTARITISRVE